MSVGFLIFYDIASPPEKEFLILGEDGENADLGSTITSNLFQEVIKEIVLIFGYIQIFTAALSLIGHTVELKPSLKFDPD